MSTPEDHGPPRRGGAAFLLAQVGAHAADRFATKVAELGLSPWHTGLLRAVAHGPGGSQQRLATVLGLLPSRVVALVDELEGRGLVTRTRSATDRRQYALHLTDDGQEVMRRIGALAQAHERDLCQALSESEKQQLSDLLRRIADQQALTPGVHPGYRRMND